MKRSCAAMNETLSQSSSSACVEGDSLLPNHHHHLGGMNYVVATYFSGSLLIHLREYLEGEKGKMYPTRKGITLTTSLWTSLLKKSSSYKESVLEGEVVLLNDCLLISKAQIDGETHVTLQRYFKKRDFTRQFCPSICILPEQEFVKLTTDTAFQKEVTSSVVTQLFTHVFPRLVLEKVKNCPLPSAPPKIELSDVGDVLTTSLLELVRKHIAVSVNTVFDCFGCTENIENQLGHECITFNYEQKFKRCGDVAMLSIDLEQLAQDFVETNLHICNYITADFFSKLNGQMLIRNAIDLYISSDPQPLGWF